MRNRASFDCRFGAQHLALVVLLCCGCAGSGEGLDANGRPVSGGGGGGPGPVSDFTQIQDSIFTPICTVCHAGAAAPLGLRLDEAVSYAMLVGVPSVQQPALLRVAPGDPDASYLVQKIEGRAAVGERMPLGGPPLTQQSIDLVRQWISQGAPAPMGALLAGLQPLHVVATIPAAGERFELVEEIVLIFSQDIDASVAMSGVFTLFASGGDNSFDEGNESEVGLAAIDVPLANPAVVMLSLQRALPADSYRLTLRGTGTIALADVDARVLDGDGDGLAGGDHRVEFIVTGPQQ
jgi:hypothetical protein